jgi:hypothetical protein
MEALHEHHEHDHHEHHAGTAPRPELGLWGWLVLVGFAMVALSRIITLFAHLDDVDSADRAPVAFAVLGSIVISAGLVGAGLFLRAVSLAIRVALVIGGCFLLLSDSSSLFGLFSRAF